ncbi:putative acetyltransferase [Zhouia amylolytica]|uniref:N-acetyltransferase GCN5 n=2 Tax=Zhouia amylolytica TaxID=376730 RepID=W2UNA5_9FLAO|nr:GNAT family N-acetyltransferase [Zhouia amylolytica]ETN95655.1 N-acetyltransferase GCN5 [Zhouia amylolytica AD3]MCQ0110845.1 GNAT family N-acetyltransferase [Zhouia amylolytica]SFS56950.1 putative acetyltransferase [Zhouia amylolytica]
MSEFIIREITPEDDVELALVLRKVLLEHDVPKVGTAYADEALDMMYETYNIAKAAYLVVEYDGRLLGGAGVAQLENCDDNICELQKMYFLEEARGKGIGYKMMQECLRKAKEYGFSKCYLETMPNMLAAQKLYQKVGFKYLDNPMGDTGHCSCPVWMLKELL